MNKQYYNQIGQIIITEIVRGETRYRGYPIPCINHKYDLLAERLLSQEDIEYLSAKGIIIKKEYDSLEEIQEIIDTLDPSYYEMEYIPEIQDYDKMYITGIYEYSGDTNEHFIHGHEYFCTDDSEYTFIMIGEDLRDYDCDKSLFKEICIYHSLSPVVYVSQSERVEEGL